MIESPPSVSPDVQSALLDMKIKRKRRTIASGVAGGTVGLLVLGPIGAVAGGMGGALLCKRAGKRRERRTRARMEATTIEPEYSIPSVTYTDAKIY